MPRSAKTKSAPAKRSQTLSAGELLARGIPRHMIQSWLVAGVLRPSTQRGVYQTTPLTERRIKAYVARRKLK